MFKSLADLSGGILAVPFGVAYVMAVYAFIWLLNRPVRVVLNWHWRWMDKRGFNALPHS